MKAPAVITAPRVTRCDVRTDLDEVHARVDVSYIVDDHEGEAAVYLPIGRDDVEVVTLAGAIVGEWDEWIVEAAQVAFDRAGGR